MVPSLRVAPNRHEAISLTIYKQGIPYEIASSGYTLLAMTDKIIL
jgi:hypothetical protein